MDIKKDNEEESIEELKEQVIEEKEIKKPISKNLESWMPKTEIGRKVKEKNIINIDDILEKGKKIIEPEIVDTLLPNLEVELILVGQSKGKFGGGKRSIWRQTQKKTQEGNKLKFGTSAVV